MKKAKISQLLTVFVIVMLFSVSAALAKESSVTIQAPEKVAKGTDVTIVITVSHNANNMFHYTEWAKVWVNGKEISRWDYSWNDRPESEVFKKEITYTVTEPLDITAEASCNLHGSVGPATAHVDILE